MSATSSENTNGARKRRGEKRKYHFCAKLAGGERERVASGSTQCVGTVSSEKRIFSEKKRKGQGKVKIDRHFAWELGLQGWGASFLYWVV